MYSFMGIHCNLLSGPYYILFSLHLCLFRWGIDRVFNGTLPKSEYFPSTKNLTKKLCIIDGGVWPEHPDLLDVAFTAADPTQTKQLNGGCPHGTVSKTIKLRQPSIRAQMTHILFYHFFLIYLWYLVIFKNIFLFTARFRNCCRRR